MIKSSLVRINLIFILLLVLFIPNFAYAETKTFIKEYTYQARDEDSKNSSRTIALREVKRLLLEELGTYLESRTEVKNFQLTKDQITMLTAGIVQTEIVDEKWDGHTYWLKSKITADSGDVIKSIDALRKDRQKTKELEDVKIESDKLLKENERLRKELTMATGEKKQKDTKAYNKNIEELNATEYYEKGYAAYVSSNMNDAIAAFSKAIEVNPKYARAFVARGDAYMRLRNYSQAIKEFDKAIEINPKEAGTYAFRGHAYSYLGKLNGALEDYNKAIEINPEAESFYCHFRGPINSALGNYHAAIEDFSKIIHTSPKFVYAYLDRARAYAQLGKLNQALEDYNRVIEIEPKNADAYFQRGITYVQLGNYKQAIKDYNKAIELYLESAKFNKNNPWMGGTSHLYDKTLADAYVKRGIAYYVLDDFNQSIKDFSRAIDLNPKNADLYLLRGNIYNIKLRNYKKAMQDSNRAIDINPKHAEAHFMRGSLYYKQGNKKRAMQDLKVAARLDHQNAQEFLKEEGIDW